MPKGWPQGPWSAYFQNGCGYMRRDRRGQFNGCEFDERERTEQEKTQAILACALYPHLLKW